MRIETPRLLIRPLGLSDVPDLVLHLNNLNVSKWLLSRPFPYRKSDAEKFVDFASAGWAGSPPTMCLFGVESKESGSVIGDCGLIEITQKSAAVGFWLAEESQSQGFGSELLRALIEFATESLTLNSLWADVYEENIGSRKLMEKFGFQLDSSVLPQRQTCRADGLEKTTLRYRLELQKVDSNSENIE